MRILGIETSCDETAVAIVEDGRRVVANLVFSQILKHKDWGGVIPELASRTHLEVVNDLLEQLYQDAGINVQDIDAIAVTQGPGLVGSLMVGVNVAKTLAWIYSKPLVTVNHLYGHICANFLGSDLEPPFICMLASGGHTQLVAMHDCNEMELLGETVDDAAGEAFDKVARLMDLPYPGGPELDKLAQRHCETESKQSSGYQFPVAKVKGLNFSFSGLKTAVLRLKQKIGEEVWSEDKANIASAFQDCVAKTFIARVEQAIEQTGLTKIVLAGGVSANTAIRQAFRDRFAGEAYELVIPSLEYCTDNAAMIAAAGYFQSRAESNNYSFEVFSRVASVSK